MRALVYAALCLLPALGCSREEPVLAQQQQAPDPIPPSTVEDIDETRTAPERGQVPAAPAAPRDQDDLRDRQAPGVILVVPRTGGATAAESDTEPQAEPFYYAPAREPETSELYEAAKEGGGPAGLAKGKPEAVVCETNLEPIDLASRVDDLEKLSKDAVGAEYKANLKRAAKMLEEANADIRRETRELEQALARGERIHREAMEMATETD